MTKAFRDNCDMNILQQTSCEPPFPDIHNQLKKYFFVLLYDHIYITVMA